MSDRIKFNSQAEFAKAIVENDLHSKEGYVYSFQPNGYPMKPFRFIIDGQSVELKGCWSDWETQTFTIVKESRFPDKSLVWCWNMYRFYAILRFWDAENDCSFNADGKRNGYKYDNYEIFTGTPPKHMEELKSKLED